MSIKLLPTKETLNTGATYKAFDWKLAQNMLFTVKVSEATPSLPKKVL